MLGRFGIGAQLGIGKGVYIIIQLYAQYLLAKRYTTWGCDGISLSIEIVEVRKKFSVASYWPLWTTVEHKPAQLRLRFRTLTRPKYCTTKTSNKVEENGNEVEQSQ
jgi:hypothetical protein